MLIGHKPLTMKSKGMDLDIESILEAKEDEQWCIITPEILYLRGTITRAKTDEVIKHILLMNSEACNADKINLFIDSGGGDMAAAYGLVSIMRSSAIPINTIAMGCCASAALVIAMAGKNRQIDKYCTVMSHIFSTANPTMLRPNELENWVLSLQLDRNAMVSHYVECTGLTAKEVLADLIDENKDIYLTAQMAVDFNMFDSLFTDYNSIHSSTRDNEDDEENSLDEIAELSNKLHTINQELQELRKTVQAVANKRINPSPHIPSWYFGPPTAAYGNFKQSFDADLVHLSLDSLSSVK